MFASHSKLNSITTCARACIHDDIIPALNGKSVRNRFVCCGKP